MLSKKGLVTVTILIFFQLVNAQSVVAGYKNANPDKEKLIDDVVELLKDYQNFCDSLITDSNLGNPKPSEERLKYLLGSLDKKIHNDLDCNYDNAISARNYVTSALNLYKKVIASNKTPTVTIHATDFVLNLTSNNIIDVYVRKNFHKTNKKCPFYWMTISTSYIEKDTTKRLVIDSIHRCTAFHPEDRDYNMILDHIVEKVLTRKKEKHDSILNTSVEVLSETELEPAYFRPYLNFQIAPPLLAILNEETSLNTPYTTNSMNWGLNLGGELRLVGTSYARLGLAATYTQPNIDLERLTNHFRYTLTSDGIGFRDFELEEKQQAQPYRMTALSLSAGLHIPITKNHKTNLNMYGMYALSTKLNQDIPLRASLSNPSNQEELIFSNSIKKPRFFALGGEVERQFRLNRLFALQLSLGGVYHGGSQLINYTWGRDEIVNANSAVRVQFSDYQLYLSLGIRFFGKNRIF